MYRRMPNEKNEPSCDVQDWNLIPKKIVGAFQLSEPYFIIECEWGDETLYILSTYQLVEPGEGA